MAWLIPTPRELVAATRSAVGWSASAAAFALVLPMRIDQLLSEVELLLARVSRVVDEAAVTVAEANTVALRAGQVVASAGRTSEQAQQILDAYRPTVLRLAPLAEQLAASISEAEVRATIKLVDQMPIMVEALVSDIMPILATLDKVGPDVEDLLDVARDVREAVIGIPGFKFFRKRGEHMIEPAHQPDNPA